MKTWMKHVRLWILGLMVLALAVGSVSWTLPTTITLTDQHGAPASDAYVRYHYESNILNFVHPITYVTRRRVVTRADAEGRIRIPFRIHFRSPLKFSTPPELYIDDIVVPRMHNTFGPILGRWTSSVPGLFEVRDEGSHFRVFDVSGDPERWDRSLRNLYDCIQHTLRDSSEAAPAESETAAYARELIVHFRRDFRALLDAHARTRRIRPDPPAYLSESQRREWVKQVDEHIAREPFWGPYFEGMWRNQIDALDKLEAALK